MSKGSAQQQRTAAMINGQGIGFDWIWIIGSLTFVWAIVAALIKYLGK
jgi:hypothetical protein